jgi:hypothetical protein
VSWEGACDDRHRPPRRSRAARRSGSDRRSRGTLPAMIGDLLGFPREMCRSSWTGRRAHRRRRRAQAVTGDVMMAPSVLRGVRRLVSERSACPADDMVGVAAARVDGERSTSTP